MTAAVRTEFGMKKRISAALVGGVVSGVLAIVMAPAASAQGSGAYSGPDFRQIVQHAKERVFPAVVYIKVVSETTEGGKRQTFEGSGSGVIVSPIGEVITNWHVIDKAVEVRCLLSDGRHFDAEIIGSDQDTDLALIQLELDEASGSIPYASLGDSEVMEEGDFVMAMGAPWGLNRSVSIGIISCKRRFLEGVSEYSLYFQTDAAINPGNSGGPLVNTIGEVIGINSRGMSGAADNMGFAIPSATVALLIDQLRDGEVQWTWTGLQLQPLRDFNRDIYFKGEEGVIVSETDPDSPARRAGIKQDDRILAVNGSPLNALTEEDLPSVRRLLGLLPNGEPAEFVLQRGLETFSVSLTPREKGEVEGEELALPRWDFAVKEINQFDNPEQYWYKKSGVFVFGVKWPGNAGSAGLQQGDILLRVGGEKVETLQDVKRVHAEAIENIESKSKVILQVLRGGLMRQIVLDFARDYERR